MIFLILSVLASSLIFIIFKLFDTYRINTLQAIIFNYITASISGMIAYPKKIQISTIIQEDWFYGTIILGIIFITVFNLMAITTQKNGLSVAAVAGKMSVVIPVLFGVFYYRESTAFLKVFGIILALIAVYMTAMKNPDGISVNKKNILFPVLVFLGSGIIDTSIKYLESTYVASSDVAIFSATIFAIAASIGIFILLYQRIKGTLQLQFKNIIAGIALGVVNYFSIYFIINALRNENLDSSTTFTINNVAILLVSTLAGILFFKEKLLLRNWIGILLSIISIILIALTIPN